MGNFNRDSRYGGGRSFDRRGFRGRGSDRPAMHKAVCSRCGDECEVPFVPSGGKPVFCSKCFEENGGSDTRGFGGRSSGRSNFGDRQMYEAVCDNCGNKCMIPFQPKSGKPVYCSKCFEDKNQRGGGDTQQYKEQFEALNTKLDKILNILTPAIPTEKVQEEKMVEEVKSSEPIKQAKKTEKKKTAVKKPTSTEKK